MPGANTKITPREKAALLMMAAGFIDDWTDAYYIADDKSTAEIDAIKFLPTSVSRWKNSEKVKKTLAEYQRFLNDRYAEERQRGRMEERERERQTEEKGGENVDTQPEKPRRVAAVVDYTNPENQAKKLNELVNRADNPGEALDALKVIISSQKADKEAAKEGKQVRTYLPISCNDCPLYEKARKKVTI